MGRGKRKGKTAALSVQPHFAYVNGDDWQGIYRDGVLISQGHLYSEYGPDLLHNVGIEVTALSIDTDRLMETGTLPELLSDIPSEDLYGDINQASSGLTYVYGDDWCGLYRDGQLLSQGHSFGSCELLELVGLDVQHLEADPDILSVEGALPDSLSAFRARHLRADLPVEFGERSRRSLLADP